MAYNAGIERFLIPYDRTFYDEVNENKVNWSLVEEFTLTPEGDKPPMKGMGRAFYVNAGQVFRVSQPGERGNICDVMFINRNNVDEANHLPTHLAEVQSLSETFDVGIDAGTPVSNKYRVKNLYPFTGKLDKVIVRLTGEDEFQHAGEAASIESN